MTSLPFVLVLRGINGNIMLSIDERNCFENHSQHKNRQARKLLIKRYVCSYSMLKVQNRTAALERYILIIAKVHSRNAEHTVFLSCSGILRPY